MLGEWNGALAIWIATFLAPLLTMAGIGLFLRLAKKKPTGFTLQERVANTMEIKKVKIDARTRKDASAQIHLESLLGNFMPIAVTIKDMTFDFKLDGKSMGPLKTDLSMLVPPLQYESFAIGFRASSVDLSDILLMQPPKRKVKVSAAGSMTIIAHHPGGHGRPEADVGDTGTINLRSIVPIKIARPDQRPRYAGFLDRLFGQPGRF